MKLAERIGRYKIYTERSKWYFATIQFVLIIAMWLNDVGFALKWWQYPLVIFFSILFFVIAGYFEVKLGILKHEQKKYGDENPIFIQVLSDLKEIKEKLNG